MKTESWGDHVPTLAMETVITGSLGGLVTILLANLATMPAWCVAICVMLTVVFSLGVRFEGRVERHLARRARVDAEVAFWQKPLEKIPQEAEKGEVWDSWLLEMEGRLRGRGRLRKARVLKDIIKRTPVPNRPAVAKQFFEGLIQEAEQWLLGRDRE